MSASERGDIGRPVFGSRCTSASSSDLDLVEVPRQASVRPMVLDMLANIEPGVVGEVGTSSGFFSGVFGSGLSEAYRPRARRIVS